MTPFMCLFTDWKDTAIWLAGRGAGGYWTWHGIVASNFSEFSPVWAEGNPTSSSQTDCVLFHSNVQGIYNSQCKHSFQTAFSLCETPLQ